MNQAHPIDRRDVLSLAFWLAVTFALCLYLSNGKQFWSDELFGWKLATDPSFHHMLAAWRLGADGGGLLFYFIARAWTVCFGSSATAFRLMNALAIGAGLVFTWLVARRWFRYQVVAFAVPLCWFAAHTILRQIDVARFYGMLLAATALAVYVYALLEDQTRIRPLGLAAVFCVHCFLVGMHPFGLVYSAFLLAAVVGRDLSRKLFRPALYASSAAGWWILLISREAMRASAAVAQPHFWTTNPAASDLFEALFFWTDELKGLGIFLLLCIVVSIFLKRPSHHAVSTAPLFFGLALTVITPVLWVYSLHGTSYFVDRYLIGTVVGVAFLLCAALDRLVPATQPTWFGRFLLFSMVTIAAAAAFSLWHDFVPNPIPPRSYTWQFTAVLPHHQPVVIPRADIFAETITAEPELNVLYPLDWETALLPESDRGEVSGYNEMENWRRAGYYSASIQQSVELLQRYQDFFVVASPDHLWFPRRVQSTSCFVTQEMGQVSREKEVETVWHVHRRC